MINYKEKSDIFQQKNSNKNHPTFVLSQVIFSINIKLRAVF